MDFSGKVALITGAASGMGAATAREFRAAGGQVVMVDLNEALAGRVAAEIGAGPALIGDVSDSAFCQRAVATALDRACRAAALCVQRPGAVESIPVAGELG